MSHDAEKALVDYYPERFLRQYGEALGKPVGLGIYSVRKDGPYTYVDQPVETADGERLATYTATLFNEQLASIICEECEHPLAKSIVLNEKIWLNYVRIYSGGFPTAFRRDDSWTQIVFPGLSEPEESFYRIGEIKKG